MLRLSKKTDYALIAMKHLALRSDAGNSSSAREMAEAYAIPVELLAKVLQRLVRSRLLVSEQGTRGGYRLGRSPQTISVADVIQAVDGPVTVTACSTEDHRCDQYSRCSVRDPLWKIRSRIIESLNTVSVAELAADGEAAPGPTDLSTVASSTKSDTVSKLVFVATPEKG
jgi:FeS assembly SUF system regulator